MRLLLEFIIKDHAKEFSGGAYFNNNALYN
jgi:hypothetical protein